MADKGHAWMFMAIVAIALVVIVVIAFAIAECIARWVNRKQAHKAPDDNCIAHGAKIFCQIDRDFVNRSGKLWDEHGVLRWRYGPRDKPSKYGWGNPFRKPDFVVTSADGSREIAIYRTSFIPPIFQLKDGDNVLGQIRTVSLFGKYAIDIKGMNVWTFRTPPFTLCYSGDSVSATDIWVTVGPSRMEWSILIRPGISDWPVVAALAFIHNHKWNYGA